MTSPNFNAEKGFTLIEVLVTLVIIALTLSIGVPAFTRLIEKTQFRSDMSQLHRTISMARTKAAYSGWTVAVCPLDTANECDRDWNQTLSVFEDRNKNDKKDIDEPMIYTIKASDESRKLRKYSRNSPITFSPQGNAFGSNGTLTYCLNGSHTFGGTVIVANSGRVRLGQDKNGDGIVENSRGRNIDCE